MALNLRATVADILKSNPEQRFTVRDLANQVMEIKKDDCIAKMERSAQIKDIDELRIQIMAEIAAQTRSIQDSSEHIKITTARPRQYYYSLTNDYEESAEQEKTIKTYGHQEHDSYPLLAQYLYHELRVWPKRINEKTSSNSKGVNGNKWLHPDMVGLQNLTESWESEVVSCADKHKFNKASLWSFEVKVKINLSNVREYFFQTVSNSSWANYSYLVAQEIDDKAMEELNILCAHHNIGVILLDVNNPIESQIMIPAPLKQQLDWNIINRILKENKDFKDFISNVDDFYVLNKLKKRDWDIPSE